MVFQTVILAQDQDAIYEITNIRIVGNDRTKEFVIHRELTFSIGDSLSYLAIDAELEKSLLNLKNTSLFNFVTVEHHPIGCSVYRGAYCCC